MKTYQNSTATEIGEFFCFKNWFLNSYLETGINYVMYQIKKGLYFITFAHYYLIHNFN